MHLTRCESKINPDNNQAMKKVTLLYNKMEYFSPNTCNIIRTSMVLIGVDTQMGGGDGMYVVQSLSSVARFATMASLFFKSRMSPGTFALWEDPPHNVAPIFIGQ